MDRLDGPRAADHVRALTIDLAVYLTFALFGLLTAVFTGYYGHRIWGNFATAGYLLAAAWSGWQLLRARAGAVIPRARWTPIWISFVVTLVAPLCYLVLRRLGGRDWDPNSAAWAAQPEVWVIERSADLLLATGTPYVDVYALGRAPEVNDYTPYGPVMALFGLPRALLGGTDFGDAITDVRVVFALVACCCVALALHLLGRPGVPVRAAQLALACPATALTWAVAGPDLAVLGLLVLAVVLAARDRPVLAGVILALVVSAKLTAAPAVAVLAILVLVRGRLRALGGFAGALIATCVVVNLPVAVVDPGAFVDHVVAFPAGYGAIESPAASPLPGHLIAGTGPVGHVAALVLLGLAALVITAWLVLRPPATGADAALLIAVGLGTATLLTPATRWGYLVYPLVLLGARLCIPDERPPAGAGTAEFGNGRRAEGSRTTSSS